MWCKIRLRVVRFLCVGLKSAHFLIIGEYTMFNLVTDKMNTSKEEYIAASIKQMDDEEKEKLSSEELKIVMNVALREFTYTKLTEEQRKMLETYVKYANQYCDKLKREFFMKGIMEGMKIEETHFSTE